ncbi:hypothetical protein AcV5_000153 [Taiwanofungus camphoratus]|nr:hypothetical protein AcV5_000153 [Antrodia cinnamomea]
MLYDVVAEDNGIGNVSVGAMAANVTCGFLLNATVQCGASDSNQTNDQWTVQAIYDDYDIVFSLTTALWPGSLQQMTDMIVFPPHTNSTQLASRNVIFVVNNNITDSNGDVSGLAPVHPPMYASNLGMGDSDYGVHTLQLIGCTLSWLPHNVTVDAQSKFLVGSDLSGRKDLSSWNVWRPMALSSQITWNLSHFECDGIPMVCSPQEGDDADSYVVLYTEDPQVDTFAYLFSFGESGNEVLVGSVASSNSNALPDNPDNNVFAQLPEQFLLDRLGINPMISNSDINVTLHDFENTLADLIASSYWAAVNLMSPNVSIDDYGTPQEYIGLQSGQAVAAQIAFCLNLNTVPLVIGFGASILLLILATVMTRVSDHKAGPINTLGVLQVVWLAHEHPVLGERIGQVNEPTTENLREAGMFEFSIAETSIARKPFMDSDIYQRVNSYGDESEVNPSNKNGTQASTEAHLRFLLPVHHPRLIT